MKLCDRHQVEGSTLLEKTILGNSVNAMLALVEKVGLRAVERKFNTPEDLCPLCELNEPTWLEDIIKTNWPTVICDIHRSEARHQLLTNVARDTTWDWARIGRTLDNLISPGPICSVCRLIEQDQPYALITTLQRAFSQIWTYTCDNCGKLSASQDTLQPEDWFSNITPFIDNDDPRTDRHFACSVSCRELLIVKKLSIIKHNQVRFRPDVKFPTIDVIKETSEEIPPQD